MTRALVVGRFQPVHRGHEALIRRALRDCEDVVIAVGSSQADRTPRDPFSFAERAAMLHTTFGGAVEVVGIPDIGDPPRWVDHVRSLAGAFDVAYGNDAGTMDLFEAAGIPTVRPGHVERGRFEGARVRRLLAAGDPAWEDAVPPPVASWVRSHDALARLAALEAQ